jgi:hypothetical protein
LNTVSDPRLKCHACGQIHSNAQLVTLHDGQVVGTYSAEWALECEAKFVCKMPTLEARRNYLHGVKEKRGAKAGSALMERVASVWKTMDAKPGVAKNPGSAAADTPADGQRWQAGKTATISFDF